MNSAKRGAVYGFKLQSLDMVGTKDQVLNYNFQFNSINSIAPIGLFIIFITSSIVTSEDFRS